MNPQSFPSFADYQSALQHPEMAFSSNFLRLGLVESDLWGFPRVRSGGFALTYKVELKDNTWATRCFHRAVRDRAIRYAQICRMLEEHQLPFFVPTRFIQHGISIHGKQYPISILKWIDGESLESFALHHLEEPEELLALSGKFREVCRQLELNSLAHGDLSHRNILVKTGEIYLIDYDGMYVPALSGRKSSELGNIHFQHPLRTNTLFDAHLDRFSSIVIFLALIALAADNSLWQRFQSGGEGLLFQRSDFLDPQKSRLFRTLEKIPETSRFIPEFRRICLSPIETVPSLEEFITGKAANPFTVAALLEINQRKLPEIRAIDSQALPDILRSVGEIATIVGCVKEVFHGHAASGEVHTFINFGNWQEDCFTTVLWGPVLEDIQRLDISLDSWEGQWISVTGLVSVRNKRPQIQVEAVTDLFLYRSEDEARKLLEQKVKKEIEKKPRKSPLIALSAKKLVTPSTEIIISPQAVFSLTDMFESNGNPVIETVLNQLYSPDRFKK
jgi:hypothetical protein